MNTEFRPLGNISDHAFAAILRAKDKNWTYKQGAAYPAEGIAYTNFFDSLGNRIAYCIYDNRKLTKQVYVR